MSEQGFYVVFEYKQNPHSKKEIMPEIHLCHDFEDAIALMRLRIRQVANNNVGGPWDLTKAKEFIRLSEGVASISVALDHMCRLMKLDRWLEMTAGRIVPLEAGWRAKATSIP